MKAFFERNQVWIWISFAVLLSAIIALQAVSLGEKYFGDAGPYHVYNNYDIFAESFDQLMKGGNLYTPHPESHWDIYKYTPTFSLFFGLFRYFPDFVGILFWNLLNAVVLLLALRPFVSEKIRLSLVVLIFILPELVTSLQNFQSNALIAGLILLAFQFLEKSKVISAVWMIALAVFIKPFALAAFVLFIFYPGKWKALGAAVSLMLVLFFLPVVVTGFDALIDHYKNWIQMLKSDRDASTGISALGFLKATSGKEISGSLVLGFGLLIFLSPLLRFRLYSTHRFRLLMLASVLIWIVIFNHKAESPTFIIAATGIAIWFAGTSKSAIKWSALAFAFVLTCLSATDLFPSYVRENVINPYNLKVLPCLVIWLMILFEMLRIRISDPMPRNA